MAEKSDLLVGQVASIVECHPNTVRNAERRGLIHPQRDLNGYRRYTIEDALKLKAALSWRGDEVEIR